MFFGPIGKSRWPPWPLICRDIFDFSSETAERNSTKLAGSKISTSSTKFVFFGSIGKTRWPPWPLICWDIFDLSSETAERNSTKVKIEAKSQHPLLSLCFSGWYEKQNGCPGLSSAEIFRLFLRNHWTEFNESWQEPRSQHPLPSLRFFLPISKQKWPPRLILQKGSTLYSGARYVALWAACLIFIQKIFKYLKTIDTGLQISQT